jgi:hypothetical protein
MNLGNAASDPEKRVSSLRGYPRLAELYADDADCETFVFREFDQLGARNLLRLQTEMCLLESKLKALDDTMCSAPRPQDRRTLLDYEAFEIHAQKLTDNEKKKQK